jgi:aminobenzoyl-glutamate utilization protein A
MYLEDKTMTDAKFENKLISFRRDLHRYPENAWTEYRTTSKIIHEFKKLGIPYLCGKDIHTKGDRMGLPDAQVDKHCFQRALNEGADEKLISIIKNGYTGAVGIIDTGRPGPVTAIRFDIDCNDVSESSEEDHFPVKEGFSSEHNNLMHACGHDAHTAIGIGVANILSEYKDELNGKIKLIFQPAEEGGRGGKSFADSGILEDVDYLFGGHIAGPDHKYGENTSGVLGMSITYKVDLIFKGLSAHAGAMPEQGKNALAAAATAALNILAISRSGKGRTRVNVGVMNAGSGRNVIPDYAILKAEVRGDTEELNEYMFERMLTIARSAALMYDCEFSHEIVGRSVDAPCDEEMKDIAINAMRSTEGITRIEREANVRGGGDDIAFMMREVQKNGGKATYLFLGASVQVPHHNSRFAIDERAIPLNAKLFGKIVFELNGNKDTNKQSGSMSR